MVEFVSSNGPGGGLLALCVLVLAHSVLLVLSFEIARLYKAYDYLSFCKVLLGKAWILYEIVIIVGLLIALSIVTSVGGAVIEDHFGLLAWSGAILILVLIVTLNYAGRRIVEESMVASVVALFLVLAILLVQLFSGHWDSVTRAFSQHSYEGGAVYKGLMYAIGGGAIYRCCCTVQPVLERAAKRSPRVWPRPVWRRFRPSFSILHSWRVTLQLSMNVFLRIGCSSK